MKSIVMKRAWVLWKSNQFKTWSEAMKLAWGQCKTGLLDINEIYAKFHNSLYLHGLRKIHNKQVMEELVSQTFLKVYQNIHNYNPERGKLSTWIYTIHNNVIIDHVRSKEFTRYKKSTSLTDIVNSGGDSTFDFKASETTNSNIDNKEVNVQVQSALNSLPMSLRAIADLYFNKEYTHAEIAQELTLPVNTVKGYIFRARAILQEQLINEYNLIKS